MGPAGSRAYHELPVTCQRGLRHLHNPPLAPPSRLPTLQYPHSLSPGYPSRPLQAVHQRRYRSIPLHPARPHRPCDRGAGPLRPGGGGGCRSGPHQVRQPGEVEDADDHPGAGRQDAGRQPRGEQRHSSDAPFLRVCVVGVGVGVGVGDGCLGRHQEPQLSEQAYSQPRNMPATTTSPPWTRLHAVCQQQ